MPRAMLSAHALVHAYGPRTILAGVSLSIDDESRIALMGQNGSRKSTLLRLLAALEAPGAGQVVRADGVAVLHLPQLDEAEDAMPVRAICTSGSPAAAPTSTRALTVVPRPRALSPRCSIVRPRTCRAVSVRGRWSLRSIPLGRRCCYSTGQLIIWMRTASPASVSGFAPAGAALCWSRTTVRCWPTSPTGSPSLMHAPAG